jgi:metallophosphoesterase superfamily enzyme
MFRFATEWILTPYRLAVHGPTRTGVIADPHLGYSDARRRAGDAVPDVSLDEQLAPLTRACAALELNGLVVAGDLCEARLEGDLIDRFLAVLAERRLALRAIVPGNHDRDWSDFQGRLPLFPDGFRLGNWNVVHGDRPLAAGPVIMGHVHPAWRQGQHIRPCYLAGPNRLVLPAFSCDAAGGAVNHSTRWAGYQAMSIEVDRVVDRGMVRASKNPRRGRLRGFRR